MWSTCPTCHTFCEFHGLSHKSSCVFDAFGCFIPTALLPSSSQAPAKALHGRPTKASPTARRHRASESTSQQSVLPTHHSQPWPLAHPVGFSKMTRKWKQSYEKLQHGLKTIFDDKTFHLFSKKKRSISISIGFLPGAVRHLFLQSLLALDCPKTPQAFNKRHMRKTSSCLKVVCCSKYFWTTCAACFASHCLRRGVSPFQLWKLLDCYPKKRGGLNDTE